MRIYPDGCPDVQPLFDTNETMPICVHTPPSSTTKGPPEIWKGYAYIIKYSEFIFIFLPESPPQIFDEGQWPRPHIVDEITTFGPNVFTHSSFDIIRLSIQINFGDSVAVVAPLAA